MSKPFLALQPAAGRSHCARGRLSGRRVGVQMGLWDARRWCQAELATFRQRLLLWVGPRVVTFTWNFGGQGEIPRCADFARVDGDQSDLLMGRSTPTTAALKRRPDDYRVRERRGALESGSCRACASRGNIPDSPLRRLHRGKWLQLLQECDPYQARCCHL
jgi:hypothetical protein